jgi:hypothetical protein
MKGTDVARWEIEQSLTGDAYNKRIGNQEMAYLAKMLQHQKPYSALPSSP